MDRIPITPRRHHALRAALVPALALLLLAGCGETIIDSSKAEDAIQADLEDTFHAKIRVVECPSDQKVEAGATFSCTVDYADGMEQTVTLKIRNEQADTSIVGLKATK